VSECEGWGKNGKSVEVVYYYLGNLEVSLGLLEFVTQSCVPIYYNLKNIRKVTSHYFLDYSLGQGTFNKGRWQ
jgi:hypothetical protein